MKAFVALSAASAAVVLMAPMALGEPAAKLATAEPSAVVMYPGKALLLDVGGKHTVSYFEPKAGECGLMVVLAAKEGGTSGTDTPGTRINVQIAPGKALRLDAAEQQSAEFLCGPGGQKMNARVYTREGYKGAKS